MPYHGCLQVICRSGVGRGVGQSDDDAGGRSFTNKLVPCLCRPFLPLAVPIVAWLYACLALFRPLALRKYPTTRFTGHVPEEELFPNGPPRRGYN